MERVSTLPSTSDAGGSKEICCVRGEWRSKPTCPGEVVRPTHVPTESETVGIPDS